MEAYLPVSALASVLPSNYQNMPSVSVPVCLCLQRDKRWKNPLLIAAFWGALLLPLGTQDSNIFGHLQGLSWQSPTVTTYVGMIFTVQINYNEPKGSWTLSLGHLSFILGGWWWWVATPGGAQSLLLALYSRITPVMAWGTGNWTQPCAKQVPLPASTYFPFWIFLMTTDLGSRDSHTSFSSYLFMCPMSNPWAPLAKILSSWPCVWIYKRNSQRQEIRDRGAIVIDMLKHSSMVLRPSGTTEVFASENNSFAVFLQGDIFHRKQFPDFFPKKFCCNLIYTDCSVLDVARIN